MQKVQFAVSAKTARLIGRENISDVDGAVIELIKNSYDADATCVFVQFDIPFPTIPQQIAFERASSVFGERDTSKLLMYYTDDGTCFVKKENLDDLSENALADMLFAYNTIWVMDNGSGMDENTLRMAWMNIGTNDKEEKKVSGHGRIKTGAKGIGRFALDKLSTETTVYTKSASDSLKKWQINWKQFDTATLLNDVTASLDEQEGEFITLAKRLAASKVKSFNQYNWETGTIIQLSPTREKWSEAYFLKINRNLKSLFPDNDELQFDIYVDNKYYPQYTFENEKFSLDNNDYDYKIVARFDGHDKLVVDLYRNEIDTRKIKTTVTVADKEYALILSEFWHRDAFTICGHKRADYNKAVRYSLSAAAVTKIAPSILETVGPIQAEMYFLKNANSTVEIVKPVVKSKRKDILDNYSGIKLYRDGFKVRPYGEDGASFDWLGLAERTRKSPAAPSHETGSWRVRTNQIIGAVRISKEANPNLTDMANREGLAINDAYNAFVSLLGKIIETFEGDRQYVLKEYAAWIKAKEKELSKTAEIVDELKDKEYSSKTGSKATSDAEKEEKEKHSRADYENALLQLEKERKQQERASRTMMLYSSAGVMTNTFSHEISRISSNVGSRMQHLRNAIKRLVGDDGYTGNPIFDPFKMIDQAEEIDKLLETWLDVIMSGADDKAFLIQKLNLYASVQKILGLWAPLLQQKLIKINPIVINGDMDTCICMMAEVDIHIVLNNFLLNSAWFLEKAVAAQRLITISITNEANKIVLLLENNGPPLDSMFSHHPEKIFYAGVSSKKIEEGEGTGLGLWITKMVVDNNSGEIHPINSNTGFGLRISLPK